MLSCETRQTALATRVDKIIGTTCAWTLWALPMCLVYVCSYGCGGENIKVDLSADAPRFIIHRAVLGWPFRWPMVTGFAIASENDGDMWELRSATPTGLPARHLAIIYGQVPSGFYQVIPKDNAAPPVLRHGRSYFVGATGPKATFRTVFALPVEALEASPPPGSKNRTLPPRRTPLNR